MIIGLGTDIVEISRIKKAIERTPTFITKVYTPKEIEYISRKKSPYPSYAGRFAGKEAIAKAFGTGIRDFSLLDIEILNDELGKPVVFLSERLQEKFGGKLNLSISHSKEYATATAILEE
ncbi:MAG: holo-ACP synthase [Psychrilyobacter sp.]|nr:holo-ACP synthase [Psychrilyobacter sp.]